MNTVTIKDLIMFLESRFNRNDTLSFYDEGGAWCELVPVPKVLIGDPNWMFNYVKDKKQHELKYAENCQYNEDLKSIIYDNFKSVNDNDIVIF